MQDSNIPSKFSIPWANGAGGSYTRVVPTASQIGITNGAASFETGFPPNCFIPPTSGGSWPFGQDFNGLLKVMTAWDRWFQAGGPISYDSAYQTAIGGYPKGAVVASATTFGTWWIATTENNVTNPDAAGAGWSHRVLHELGYTPVQQGTGVGQNVGNVVKIGWSAGSRVKITIDTTDLGNVAMESNANVWTAVNTFNSSPLLVNNVPLQAKDTGGTSRSLIGYLSDNWVHQWAGANGWVLKNEANTLNLFSVDPSGNVAAGGAISANGAITMPNNVALQGKDTGGTLHNLLGYLADNYIHQYAGANGWVLSNQAASVNLLILDTAGNLTSAGVINAGGAIGATGNVTATSGKLRATLTTGGDLNAAVLLQELSSSLTNPGYLLIPTAAAGVPLILQFCRNVVGTTNGGGGATVTFTFPHAFTAGVLGYCYCMDNEAAAFSNWTCVANAPGLGSQSVNILAPSSPFASVAISGFVIGY